MLNSNWHLQRFLPNSVSATVARQEVTGWQATWNLTCCTSLPTFAQVSSKCAQKGLSFLKPWHAKVGTEDFDRPHQNAWKSWWRRAAFSLRMSYSALGALIFTAFLSSCSAATTFAESVYRHSGNGKVVGNARSAASSPSPRGPLSIWR